MRVPDIPAMIGEKSVDNSMMKVPDISQMSAVEQSVTRSRADMFLVDDSEEEGELKQEDKFTEKLQDHFNEGDYMRFCRNNLTRKDVSDLADWLTLNQSDLTIMTVAPETDYVKVGDRYITAGEGTEELGPLLELLGSKDCSLSKVYFSLSD